MADEQGEDTDPGQRRDYTLICSSCGRRRDDDGLILDCAADHEPALLRTQYDEGQFSPRPGHDGLFRYRGWLPVAGDRADVGGAGRTVVYRSRGIASLLGLSNLRIAFNGYWPERAARLETATFKELEAHTVLGRLPERQVILTVASSGNTGAAFAWACSRRQVPCLLIVPGRGLARFRFREPLHPCVSLVVIDDGDYPDAIDLAAAVARIPPFHAEGGVKNVGRRDGLGTVLLSAFEEMQCLPAYYFQAAGSGTGAIGVLEVAKRIRGVASESALPRLMLCQNQPFTPIHDAWRMRRRSLGGRADHFRQAIAHVYADELTNWAPPYAIRGGVYDCLVESEGDVLAASNADARAAADAFLALEGIDIEPAAGVAVACLRDAVARGAIEKDSPVLLNITGGGRRRLARDHSLVPAQPWMRLTRESLAEEGIADRIAALCATSEVTGA